MENPEEKLRTNSQAGNSPKIFGIGFHKTGTTSLGEALQYLGYKVCHGAGPVRQALGQQRMMQLLYDHDLESIFAVADQYEAFQDNPWYILYEELDQRFAGSKFILTTRDENRWLQSVVNHFKRTESDFRMWIYDTGSPVGNEHLFVERYRRHNREVSAYFADRPEDLLVVNWEEGNGWAELCGFLQRNIPDSAFPHANTGDYSSPRRRRLKRLLGKWKRYLIAWGASIIPGVPA